MNPPGNAHSRAQIAPSPAYGGNGLFATEEIRAGELILDIGRPLVEVPDIAFLPDTCSSCFAWVPKLPAGGPSSSSVQHQLGSEGLKICTGCKVTRYCNKTCQSNAWNSHHKYECKLFARLYPQILPTAVRAVIRLLLLRSKGQLTEEQWFALIGLISHVDDFRRAGGDKWDGICLMSKGTHAYSNTTFTEDFVCELFCRVLVNSLALTTPTFDPLGICLDPLVASINHSCDENAVVVFDGSRLCLRSIQKIEKGQEIFISYVDNTDPTARRQNELETRYFFTCTCPKCRSSSPRPEDTLICPHCNKQAVLGQTCYACHSTDLPDFTPVETRIFHMLDHGGHKNLEPGLAVLPLRNSLSILRDTKVWPVTRQPMPVLHHRLAVDYLTSQQWVLALQHMLKVYFDIDPFLFPQPFHPVRVVHHWALANLVVVLADLAARGDATVKDLEPHALEYGRIVWGLFYEVEQNADMSHGRESRFAGVVRRKVEELKIDMTRGSAGGVDISREALEPEWAKLREIAKLA